MDLRMDFASFSWAGALTGAAAMIATKVSTSIAYSNRFNFIYLLL
jgi:hypothetical protein